MKPRNVQNSWPAVFINKDGALTEGASPGAGEEDLRRGAPEALAALAHAGFALVVVANQSGIERGYFSRARFAQLQAGIERALLARGGVVLTDFLLCPHAPGPGDVPKCLCRLPAPGMLVRATLQNGIDLARSWMVGGTLDDVEAGRRAGCRAVLLDRGDETEWRRSPLRTPDRVCSDWGEVVREIIGEENPARPAAAARAGTEGLRCVAP